MGGDLHIIGFQPDPLAASFDALLLMNHYIAHHARDLHAVGSGRIRAQYDAALQMLANKGLPIDLPHGTGSTRDGDGWIQFDEHQGFGASALDPSSPLLPKSVFAGLLFRIRQLHWRQRFLVAGCFINFDLFPGTGSTSKTNDDMGLW